MGSILVVEDEMGILFLIEAALKRFGHQVEIARDGKEAIRKFDCGRFDLVITDCIMPEAGGHDVLRHIRRTSPHWIPVIGMSGTPWQLQQGDFDMVLTKPFALTQLVQALRGLPPQVRLAGAVA